MQRGSDAEVQALVSENIQLNRSAALNGRDLSQLETDNKDLHQVCSSTHTHTHTHTHHSPLPPPSLSRSLSICLSCSLRLPFLSLSLSCSLRLPFLSLSLSLSLSHTRAYAQWAQVLSLARSLLSLVLCFLSFFLPVSLLSTFSPGLCLRTLI